MRKIIFSDVDGTLLNSNHKITKLTEEAIKNIIYEKNYPFVIVSARSPSGIYPILNKYNFNCYIVSYSGGLILDDKKNVLYHKGFSKKETTNIINFIEENKLDLSWCLYSFDKWIVKDKNDRRIINEENIVEAQAINGNVNSVTKNEVNKVLCICNPSETIKIEKLLKEKFKDYSIAKSSDCLIEIMQKGINKANAIKFLCSYLNIPLNNSIAFGDNYNDLEMLETVGNGFLMDNAPKKLKKRIVNHTNNNDNDGIYYALKSINLI